MKIILTGGGTAGHVTPHLNLLPKLKKEFDQIEYIGSKNGIEKELITKAGLPYHQITTCKFVRKKLWKNLSLPFRLIKGICEAKKVLKTTKPDVIFSKGGFVSVPVVLAANRLGIPVVAHESDKSPGLANKLCSKKCKVVFTSFEDTAQKLKNGKYSGPPLAPPLSFSKEEAKAKLGIKTTKPILLVTGGSLGATALNKIVLQNLNFLTQNFYVYHITGRGNLSKTKTKNYEEQEYTNQMPLAMRAADFAITRGGSNTIFELASNAVPMLIIPLPKGNSRGDQQENAEYFKQKDLALSLEQSQATPQNLIQQIKKLTKEAEQIKKSQTAFFKTNAIALIAKELSTTAKQ